MVFGYAISTVVIVIVIVFFGVLAMLSKFYRKVEQGQALVRNGIGGTRVTFSGMVVIPILHNFEIIDISVKRVTIDRQGSEGLICKDNMRADIKVAFFVRVNKTVEDVLKVAQSIGCIRASQREALQELFEAKFSEALKTVGKQFNFVDLYNSREQFKEEILKVIGTDLNGFILDDAAIDFLEQTSVDMLNPDNILDSEGIKKITSLTSDQKILANQIDREREKTITKQNVEAKETILELNRQLAKAENEQRREVESIKAREDAEIKRVQQEEQLKAEAARISTEEEIAVAEENKNRQIIVAQKNKERTEAVESERVERDRAIEATERERIVALAQIEKDKAIEVEKREIQNVIRERVAVEKTVVEEEERIKDTREFAAAEREKRVVITKAEKEGEEAKVISVKQAEASKQAAELKAEEEMYQTVKAAEASRKAAELKAEEVVIEADATQTSAEKKAAARKALAEAEIIEKAAPGMAEVKVAQEKMALIEPKGSAEAKVIALKAQAEAKGVQDKGMAEARVKELNYLAEAKGISEKAEAMKLYDEVGREHEEFKLRLNKDKEIALADIDIRRDVAQYHATVLAEALKSTRVDIVGGETTFFESIINAVSMGKTVDRYVDNSQVLSDIKETFFNADPEFFRTQLRDFFSQFGLSVEDLKSLSVSAALAKLAGVVTTPNDRNRLYQLLAQAGRCGVADTALDALGIDIPKKTESSE